MTGSPGADDNPDTGAKPKSQVSARRARERDLERRRARGEISCAECRRLKLKCNKKVPCASCIRRGCHTICPNGLLTTGQGSRFVLANTDKLHGKLLQMSQRIRQLEDALQIAHSSVSKTAHPLLSEDLLAVKSGVDGLSNGVEGKDEEDADEEEKEIAAALGTLAISECGATRFVGRVAAETLLMNEPMEETSDHSHVMNSPYPELEDQLPELLINSAKDFPLQYRYLPREELLKVIFEHIPSYERATALVEAYLENVGWLPRPIEREQIMETLLPLLYKGKYLNVVSSLDEDGKYKGTTKMHNLALALAVFSCGAAGDLTQAPNNQEGKLYHVLSLAALNGHSIIGPGGASLETVQALVLIAQYHFFSGDQVTLEASWKIVSFALVIAASIGLHRDPAHWNMETKYIQRRRFVFWEIFALDKWKSLGTGRPACFHMQEIDCEFPDDKEAFVDKNGKLSEGPNRWRHRLVKELIGPLAEHLCLTRPIKYSEILDWDRKLREFGDPPVFTSLTESGTVGDVRLRLWAMHKQIAILNIHRNFFARAMMKHAENPLRSPFAPSFLAAYASSINLLRNMRVCYDLNPGSLLRIWPLWTHCLTSSVILGSVACNASQPQLSGAAFQDLDHAITLFEEAQIHPVCKRGLPILVRLRDRARTVLQNLASQATVPPGITVPKVEPDETDELAALRGTTRLVHRTHKSPRCPSQYSSTDSRGTPNSVDSANTSSSSPVLPMESEPGTRNTNVAPDAPLFASPVMDTPGNSGSSSVFPGQDQFSNQPTAVPVTQDIVSLFNTLYNSPTYSSDPTSLTTSPDPNFNVFGQQPQPQAQQLPHYVFGTANPQTIGPINSGQFSSNSWFDEAAQLQSMLSGTYGDPSSNFDGAPSTKTSTPPYEFTWLSEASEPGGSSQVSGNTAQFMEDWRFQAAMEGSHFLAEPDTDARMTFLS